MKYFAIVMTGEMRAMRDVLRRILHLPRRAFKAIGSEELATMLSVISWMSPAPQCADMVLTSFRHRCRRYYLPKANFENGTCLEFAMADDLYNRFRETKNPEDLLLLVATLCREKNPDAAAALAIGDVRIPLTDRDQAEARARRLGQVPAEIVLAVLYYFVGVKLLIKETYHDLFDEAPEPVDEDGEDAPQPIEYEGAGAGGPRFGWWSTFIQVAKTGILGDYNTLLQRRMHLLCITLLEQHDEAEKLKRHQERTRNKFTNDD